MPKRKPNHVNGPPAKTKKVNDQPSDAAVDEPPPPAIFNLVDDCCYPILDYLPLDDVKSFSQTCKWAQRVAANFYKINYSAINYLVPKKYDSDVGFELENVQKVTISGRQFGKFRAVEDRCHPPMKQIHLKCTTLSAAKINCLKKVLPSVERVIVENCKFNGDLYKSLLKFCVNLKVLCVVSDSSNYNSSGSPHMIGKSNKWLAQKYPNLERFTMTHFGPQQIDELKTFFEENPNVRHFATDSTFFLANYDLLTTTNMKLETLTIRFVGNNLATLCDNLNSLHGRGVFKRLRFSADRLSCEMLSLNALEKLVLAFWGLEECLLSPHLASLKELRNSFISECHRKSNYMNVIARNLVNLERVALHARTYHAICPFIFQSAKLKEIKFGYSFGKAVDEVINLRKWNKERGELAAPRKVTIYVPESIYLATKRAMDKTDYNLLELKRESSYDWNDDFTY